VHVNRINHVTDALAYIGRHIEDSGIAGTVENITVRGGIPFLNVRTANGDIRQLDFLNYLVNRSGGTSSGSNAPPPGTGTPPPSTPPETPEPPAGDDE
jgi:hypothetical protein